MSYNHLVLFYFIFYFYVLSDKVFGKNIKNSNDFINGLKDEEEIFILQNDIILSNEDALNVHSKKVVISGKSKNTNISFSNNFSINLSFLSNCEEIELKNISITGNIKFNNNHNIKFDNVFFNGYFISVNDNEINNNSTLQLLNSELHLVNEYIGYEIYNYNLDIKNSEIYGNDVLNLNLMSIINERNNTKSIVIDNTYFSGNYFNGAINVYYADITCSNSHFEKFFGGRELNKYSSKYTSIIFNIYI